MKRLLVILGNIGLMVAKGTLFRKELHDRAFLTVGLPVDDTGLVVGDNVQVFAGCIVITGEDLW